MTTPTTSNEPAVPAATQPLIYAAPAERTAPTLVTRDAPGFTAEAVMPDKSFKEISLSDYWGKYVLLLFYPFDFTYVCPTEIIALEVMLEEFKKNRCQVLAISTDSKYTHLAWRNTASKEGGIGEIHFPLVSDLSKNIARSYGILYRDTVALRGLFIIDPLGKVRHALVNDLPVGRNIEEALRTLRAIQLVDEKGEFCPANWHPGDPGINALRKSMQQYLKNRGK
jgi:peroxiredoxin (alkyl hydroperoxide reductase subunit C)